MDLREAALAPERRHPWELARLRAVRALLARGPLPARPSLLDIGCGDGWLLAQLATHLGATRAVGVDTGFDAAADPRPMTRTAEAPAGDVVTLLGNLDALPTDSKFDLVLLLDVLEHVADDLALLETARDRLTPGGLLLVTVPAHPALFSAHDAFLAHHRRYRPRDLVSLARRANLHLLERGGLFASLLLPRALSVLAQRALRAGPRARGVSSWRGGSRLTALVTGALTLDNQALLAAARRGVVLPGLSAWMLCQHPGTPSRAR